MSDTARQRLARDRQHDKHQHETLLERAEERLDRPANTATAEQARELQARDRQHEKHQHETLLERAEEGI